MKPSPSEEAVFSQALACTTPGARDSYLAAACGTDVAFRRRVEDLLRAVENAGDFLERPPEGLDRDLDPAVPVDVLSEKPGDTIGRYKLLDQIGEGGFGVVYRAWQQKPVQRHVALKIVKLGMDTKSVIARFEAERQALAMMGHPSIAKVLDAGATGTGRPYFVMELVEGVPITRLCYDNRLGVRERLELMVRVCQAIQHAHQKGIIHRDIKPSNVMVALHDGVPVPKVIDFGIAKATQQELTQKTLFTQYGQFLGTPAYMSPEQTVPGGLDIDTRSDVYSLGVLLYEVLTGSTPFDTGELLRSGMGQMLRTIREKEPIRPSTRLNQRLVAAEATGPKANGRDVSAYSRRRIREHVHRLKGDLDWIVLKCLEKDRTLRYDTANGLAMDLKRHLMNEPVLARPPSTVYRIQKAWRRNKLAYAAAALVATALVVGTTVSAWQAAVATQARNEAEDNLKRATVAEGRMEEALDLAEQDRDIAVQSAQELRRQIYVSDIGLARRAIDDGDAGRARALLGNHQPEPGQRDLRGFEWRFLWSRSRGDSDGDLGEYVGYLSGLTISPDRPSVALNRRNPMRLEVIHLFTGSVEQTIEVPDLIAPLCYSPSGRVLVGMGQGGIVGWDTQTWEALKPVPLTFPFALGYLEDQEIMVAREDDHLSMWDLSTWQALGTLENTDPEGRLLEPSYGLGWHMMNAMAISSERGIVYLAGARSIRRWDLTQRTELSPLEVKGMGCLATSGDGQLAGADSTGKVLLIQPDTGDVMHTFDSHAAWTTCLEFTRDGNRLVSANEDRLLVIHDVVKQVIIGRLVGHRSDVSALDISADGRTAVSGSDRVLRWSLDEPGGESFDLGGIKVARILEDGRILVYREQDDDLAYYDPLRGVVEPAHARQLVHAIRESGAEPIAFSPTATWAVSIDGSSLKVWDMRTGEPVRSLTHRAGTIGGALFSPDGRFLMTGSQDSGVRLWQTRDWTSQPLGPSVFTHLHWGAFARDTRRAAVTGQDGTVRVFDFEQKPREIAQYEGAPYAVALSSDGRWLAGGAGGPIHVWDLELDGMPATLLGHVHGVFSLSFSPDDRTLASSSGARVTFWNVETWRELMSSHDNVPPRTTFIPQVAFSPDGRYLARTGAPVGETDIQCRIWTAPRFAENDTHTTEGSTSGSMLPPATAGPVGQPETARGIGHFDRHLIPLTD